jgi:hypothetical protein
VENFARIGGMRYGYVVFLGKPKGKGLLGQLRRKWEDNIKINLKERGRGFVHYIHLLQYRQ